MLLIAVASVLLAGLSLPGIVAAQGGTAAGADVAARVTEARKANAALMRQYSWTSRMEIFAQGQVKDIRLDAVSYGPSGQLQRTIMNDQSASLPRGFLRRRMADDERKRMEEYLVGLRDMLDQYTLSTTGKVQEFLGHAKATGPDAAGLYELSGQNVLYQGDTLSLWVDPLTRHVRRIQVSATFQGDPVNLSATFKTLPSGLNHVAYAELTVPAKQITVQVQNFDYSRNN